MLKINFRDMTTNKEVVSRMHTELHFLKDMMNRQMKFAEHVLRGSAGVSHLQIRGRGNMETEENKRYMDSGCAEMNGMENVWRTEKGSREDRVRWKLMIVNLRTEDDKWMND